ncbi:NAD(P)H-hydrate dehydratase [Swingsia samuiensis]|uniref:Bifunctional NAD(P)H-hydrate repair enzyme n=1 Tax=Swingsia samuiensis TaxID=1293412 RepID=A0A4Y6UHB6_9PROT|nr:NAD(P)H-hydrate dehydratase [Swingsia samuiensis]QDH16210.1 NAD(P)H-hydrate dehydratase [Swingsia samuiensis]
MALSAFTLLTPEQSAAMDQIASEDVGVSCLMENAGWVVARAIRRRFSVCKVVVVCGPGNNGGDGYVAARLLSQWGWPVKVMVVAPPQENTAAYKAAAQWEGITLPLSPLAAQEADLLVDAVYGAGLARDVSSEVLDVLAAVKRRVAVDVPSGLSGLTGKVKGGALPCLLTVTFVRPRPGHFLEEGPSLCGDLVCADIGMPQSAQEAIEQKIVLNWPGLWRLPSSKSDDYKYRRGVVSVCGGSHMAGAARLAARAARRTGAGLVRIVTSQESALVYRIGDPGIVVDDSLLEELLEDKRRNVWVCGPGLILSEVSEFLPSLLKAKKTVVADAGALAWAAEDISRLRGVAVITPHIGEFEKIFGSIKNSRMEAAQAAAETLQSVVVLKGPDTVIASPNSQVAINGHATSALATAGSGDTLVGIIAALIAAGMPVWEASCAGVWLHGEAGILAGLNHGGWPIAEDLDLPLGKARAHAERLSKVDLNKNPVTALL